MMQTKPQVNLSYAVWARPNKTKAWNWVKNMELSLFGHMFWCPNHGTGWFFPVCSFQIVKCLVDSDTVYRRPSTAAILLIKSPLWNRLKASQALCRMHFWAGHMMNFGSYQKFCRRDQTWTELRFNEGAVCVAPPALRCQLHGMIYMHVRYVPYS